jgi:4-hydroxythreonine-4-phosphate dehydrogenase
MTAELVGLDIVRSGPALLTHTLRQLGRNSDAVVCDAETDEDLRAVATASLGLHPTVMWAGSAGLAHQLLSVARLARNKREEEENGWLLDGPTLFVVGSSSSVSRAQVEVLSEDCNVHCIGITPRVLRNEDPSGWNVCERSICDELLNGRDVLVHMCGDGDADFYEGRPLAVALGKLIGPCANVIGALVLTGGETAREVLDILGVKKLRLLGEVEPGLPYSVTEGRKAGMLVLTKAGAFGNPQSLVHCREFLRTLARGALNLPRNY